MKHHTGYEDYWKNRKDVLTNIEFIGSVCTIIYEKYVENNIQNKIEPEICKLLIAGIIDNTLNLKANITTQRDIDAYTNLLKIGNLSENWNMTYFASCQRNIIKDLKKAIANDIKIEYINEELPEYFGQLLILDGPKMLENQVEIINIMNSYNDTWLINIISLVDGKSYILSSSDIKTVSKLEKLLDTKSQNNLIVLEKYMLRKEIIKKARTKTSL